MAELRGTGETIRFRATDGDGDGDWWVRLRPDGFGLDPAARAAGPADATVHGAAADLLLLLYGRLPHDAAAFTLDGDRGLIAHWCANSAF